MSPLAIAVKSVSLLVTNYLHTFYIKIQNFVFTKKKLFNTSKSLLARKSIMFTATNTIVHDWKV